MLLEIEDLPSSTRWSRVQQRLRGLWWALAPGAGRVRTRWAVTLLVCGALAASCWRPSPPSPSWSEPASDPRILTKDEARVQAGRRLPSLPLAYWDKRQYEKHKNICAPYPLLQELEFHNTYWQTLRTRNGTFHLYGAYLDVREASPLGPVVRLLAVHDRINVTQPTHCYLWYDGVVEPVVERTAEHRNLWRPEWGNYFDNFLQPYLVTCVLPRALLGRAPASVSLVSGAYDCATNNLRVHYHRPAAARKDFAVCVKGLDFYHRDVSVRLIEWIELVLLMGADKIFFYELHVHPNISKVLEYYAARGAVTVTPLTLPGGMPNLPGLQHLYLQQRQTHRRQMELIPYNDCLYRHLYEYRWVVPLDIDEMIVPVEDGNWAGLMRRLVETYPAHASHRVHYLYFLDTLRRGWQARAPRHMYMLQHVHRAPDFIDPSRDYYQYYFKSIHEVKRVVALHNHVALACFGGCTAGGLGNLARLHHYRAGCGGELRAHCGGPGLRARSVRDDALWRWRDPPRWWRALIARCGRSAFCLHNKLS